MCVPYVTVRDCSYFNENQYPDEAKREEISNACNAVIQKPGERETESDKGVGREERGIDEGGQ